MWRCCSDRLALAICLTVVSVVSVVTLIVPDWASVKFTWAETSGSTSTAYYQAIVYVSFGLWHVDEFSELDVDFPPEKRIFRLNQVAAISGAVVSLSFAVLYYARQWLAEAGTADLWTGGTVLLLQAALTFIAFHYWVDYFTRRYDDIEDAFHPPSLTDSSRPVPSSVRAEDVVACKLGCGLQGFCAALYLMMSLAIFTVLLSRGRGHQTFNAVALEVPQQQQTSALFVEEDRQEEDPKA